MNSAEFFMLYAGNRMLPESRRTGDAVKDADTVLNMAHPLYVEGRSLRLSSCWMVITPGKVTTSFKAHPSTGFDTSGNTDRKTAIAQAVAQGDCMVLALSKRSMTPADLFITYDRRAVRLCSPGEVQTINMEEQAWTS